MKTETEKLEIAIQALEDIKFLMKWDIRDFEKGLFPTDKYAKVRLRDIINPALEKIKNK
jgi:hypothetical protein